MTLKFSELWLSLWERQSVDSFYGDAMACQLEWVRRRKRRTVLGEKEKGYWGSGRLEENLRGNVSGHQVGRGEGARPWPGWGPGGAGYFQRWVSLSLASLGLGFALHCLFHKWPLTPSQKIFLDVAMPENNFPGVSKATKVFEQRGDTCFINQVRLKTHFCNRKQSDQPCGVCLSRWKTNLRNSPIWSLSATFCRWKETFRKVNFPGDGMADSSGNHWRWEGWYSAACP